MATPDAINFMAKHGRGLICLALTAKRSKELGLELMSRSNRSRHETAFTVSIEAREGVTTGISAPDRARTISVAIDPEIGADDIHSPGHVFPLVARDGGVLVRTGHTEASVDVARLAGLNPSGVICEIMNEDGTMARLPELKEFAARHGLKIGTIADLIRYCTEHESTIQRVGECTMPTEFGDFRVVAYHDDIGDAVHLALVRGDIRRDRPTLVRVHVQESLLDLVTTAHRAGSWSLHEALAYVAAEGTGVVAILQQEEKPADLVQRIRDFQVPGKALESGGGRRRHEEMRTYGLGSQILADLGVGKMRVLGHAMKAPGLSGFGLEIAEYVENDTAQSPRKHHGHNKEKKVSG
jgi:3,4-dihydroxy 2-butanone 4-phosphate synthase/GTP cyclohydrolase II